MNAGRILMLAAVPEGRVFGLDQQTLISIGIQLFNACFLFVVLSFVLYKPVRNFLLARTERIGKQLQNAQEGIANAEDMKAQYEQRLKAIELERIGILESAHAIAAEKSEQLLDKARKEAAEMRERVAEEIQKERERAAEETKVKIVEAASLMAEKLVAHAIDEETQDRLFAETMAELEEVVWWN